MTIEQIKSMLNGAEYNFLRTSEHLGDRMVFLTLGGSYAYGTNTDTSDVDIRGCALNRPSDLLGLSGFEQVVDTATDTTIYSFNKLIGLLLNSNPNTIELLGCKPEYYFHMTDIGREMITNRKLFLSKRAVQSFGGYAYQQLNRMENAIARDRLTQAKKEKAHLDKHAMHLIRLYLMCLDILERGEIVTCREAERELLMSIRNGAYRNEDGTYRQEFFDMVKDLEQRTAYAAKHTELPEQPNLRRIEEFVMSVNYRAVMGEYYT